MHVYYSPVSKLLEADWSKVIRCLDVNMAWSSFCKIFVAVLDQIAPFKVVRIKQRSEPWINNDILSDIRERDFWLNKFKNTHVHEFHQKYCKLRNKVQRDIKKAKQDYMINTINDNKNNPKQLWKNLKSLGYSKKCSCSANIVLNNDGVKIHESKQVANYFNTFFTGIATKLAAELPASDGLYNVDSERFCKFYENIPADSFQIHEVTTDFVLEEILKLNSNKSTGLDNIPARFLKDAAEVVQFPLTHIINLSIRNEIFPDAMKAAKVKPLYKKKSRLEVGNYRPVSVLSVPSKIYEKAVFMQLNDYPTDNNLLYQFQSGFRGRYSTDTCLIYLQDYIRDRMSEGKFTGMVLLDIQKAFDSVNHEILIGKLKALGVKSTPWFKSYLANMPQIVNVNGNNSYPRELTCGVPQGSILGPLLFLCYVNDMPMSVDCLILQYTDDGALLVSDKSPLNIARTLQRNLENCNMWLINNKLSLHMGKTELILFGTKRKIKQYENFFITCCGHTIKSTPSVNYLGLDLDSTLSGDLMSSTVIKKVNSRLKFLYRQANYFDTKTKKTLSTALVLCLFDFSISSWYGGISKTMCKKLQCAQNKVIRFILNKCPFYHINAKDFQDLGILNVKNRAKQLRLNHVFKIIHSQGPPYLTDKFTKVSQVHTHNTRSSQHNFYMHKCTTSNAGSFYINGIHDWAEVPNTIKSITVYGIFKKSIKDYLLQNLIL